MKKALLLFLLMMTFTLEGTASATSLPKGVSSRKVNCFAFDVKKKSKTEVFFFDGQTDIPYLSVEEVSKLLQASYKAYGSGSTVKMKEEKDGRVSFIRENGSELCVDYENNSILFRHFDLFFEEKYAVNELDIVTGIGSGKNDGSGLLLRRSILNRSGALNEIKLSDYGIFLHKIGKTVFIPLATVSDIFFCGRGYMLLWNGENVFIASDVESGSLKKLWADVQPGDRSEELADFSYREFCLAMDLHYGLKDEHDISNFANFFSSMGIKEELSNSGIQLSCNALSHLCDYCLADGHSKFISCSPMLQTRSYTLEDIELKQYGIQAVRKKYQQARTAAYPNGVQAYEEIGDTAFVTFDSFSADFAKNYYNLKLTDTPVDTIELILYAHSKIRRKDSPIHNVVIDLSNNGGGYLSVAVCIASWILGESKLQLESCVTGAKSITTYYFDADRDHDFDAEKDSIRDLNLYCIISPVSFSCGNLLPALLKSSANVEVLGRTSRGGGCTTQKIAIADGTVIQTSSHIRLNIEINGTFYEVDSGVKPDRVLLKSEDFYNRQRLVEMIREEL